MKQIIYILVIMLSVSCTSTYRHDFEKYDTFNNLEDVNMLLKRNGKASSLFAVVSNNNSLYYVVKTNTYELIEEEPHDIIGEGCYITTTKTKDGHYTFTIRYKNKRYKDGRFYNTEKEAYEKGIEMYMQYQKKVAK